MSDNEANEFSSATVSPVSLDPGYYRDVFEHMLSGMAYCAILFNDGTPIDFKFLYANPAFNEQIGLGNVSGKLASDVFPSLRKKNTELLKTFTRVAQSGKSEKFEAYIDDLAICVSVSASSPSTGYFVALFDEVTEYKLAEKMLQVTEERYRDIFENTNDLIQCVATDGSFIYTNKKWREALGYTEQEVTSLKLADVLHPDSMACCQDRFKRLLDGEELSCISFMFRSKDGKTVHLSGDCGSIIKDGETISTRGIFKDITDTVEVDQALQKSEARYKAIYDNAPDIYSVINQKGEFLSVNRTGAEMLGYSASELVGESVSKVIHPEDQPAVFSHIESLVVEHMPDQGIEYRKIRKDGSIFWVHQRVTFDPDDDERKMLIVCRDITDKRQLEQQLVHYATHDALTNLVNRREFEKRLQRLLEGNSEPGSEHVLCLIDLDKFKTVNDSCGHLAGDELLRQIATLLKGRVRARDTLARIGGDEFAILMEYCSVPIAEKLAEKIRTTVADFKFHWRSNQFSIGISIGILPVNSHLDLNDAMSLADKACYEAKSRGGNQFYVYNAPSPSTPKTGDEES